MKKSLVLVLPLNPKSSFIKCKEIIADTSQNMLKVLNMTKPLKTPKLLIKKLEKSLKLISRPPTLSD